MDIERIVETKRLKLLRLVAGWLTAVLFVSAGPFSISASARVVGFVLSILSRAELAAQYLVIVQAQIIAARTGSEVNSEQLLDYGLRANAGCENAVSLSGLRQRLEALRALLEDLPRFGLRLLRRTEKQVRRLLRMTQTHQTATCHDTPEALRALRVVGGRIERPPDKRSWHSQF